MHACTHAYHGGIYFIQTVASVMVNARYFTLIASKCRLAIARAAHAFCKPDGEKVIGLEQSLSYFRKYVTAPFMVLWGVKVHYSNLDLS